MWVKYFNTLYTCRLTELYCTTVGLTPIAKCLIIYCAGNALVKVNDKDILRVCKFSKTQPRPVAKNANPLGLRWELNPHPRKSSGTLCQLSHICTSAM